jgi:uncharacterized phage protein (TIGR01671 family)
MQRLKFRVWDKKGKVMFIVKGMAFEEDLVKVKVEKDGRIMELPAGDIEIMQFTGIVDNDGSEVYEGDIVKVLGKHNQLFGYVWFNGFFYTVNLFNVPGADNWPIMKEENIRSLDVIGNIYENHDMLEPKNDP